MFYKYWISGSNQAWWYYQRMYSLSLQSIEFPPQVPGWYSMCNVKSQSGDPDLVQNRSVMLEQPYLPMNKSYKWNSPHGDALILVHTDTLTRHESEQLDLYENGEKKKIHIWKVCLLGQWWRNIRHYSIVNYAIDVRHLFTNDSHIEKHKMLLRIESHPQT